MNGRSTLRFGAAAALGAASALSISSGRLPFGWAAVALAIAFIVLLPRRPWEVAAFVVGVGLALVVLTAVWTNGWGCASEVNGQIVEHDCAQPPPSG